ncbi:aromatic motif membrane protein [Mycoplasma buteonis]|uniref:aromatic motif membrane protein n=1 Tax=Mycoplasma buteonis TaxID=171280 RepID=UPI00056A1464|nr:aromatic motif membrane protein [Mycoplasma buteonis]
MKKIKFFLSLATASVAAPVTLLSSCNTVVDSTKTDKKADLLNNFDTFVQQKLIQDILTFIYQDNSQAKNEYIQSQKELLNTDYNQKIAISLRYANNITGSMLSYSSYYSFAKAAPIEFGNDITSELSGKNWLYYLFNINKMTFMQDAEFARDKSSDEFNNESAENRLLYNNFYKPSSNEVLDYVVQDYADNNYETEKRFYALNKDGFIYDIRVSAEKEEESLPRVNILRYLYTYPKLVTSKNKLNEFSLLKFVQDTKSFEDFNPYDNNTHQILFTDKYGGSQIRYTVVDINND